ncbi:MAG: hypothetical protein JEZ12_02155 [Desulfobacterium sp.]|nr:hypothetical protein [Desulfobacterium sp.]
MKIFKIFVIPIIGLFISLGGGQTVFAAKSLNVGSAVIDNTGDEGNGAIEQTTPRDKTEVTVGLKKEGQFVIKGNVVDQAGALVTDALVTVFNADKNTYESPTDTNEESNYSITLPVEASSTGWKAFASKDGYYVKDMVEVPDLWDEGAESTTLTLYRETPLAITVGAPADGIVRVSIKADNGSGPLTGAEDVKVYDAEEAGEILTAFNDGVVSFTMVNNDFVLLVKPGSDTVYIRNQAFTYRKNEPSSATRKSVSIPGGKFNNGADKDNYDTVEVTVPVNGLAKSATLEINTIVKTDTSKYSNGTPGMYVEINAIDNDTGLPLETGEISRIEITIPFDTTVITTGDFAAPKAFIYYADAVSLIESGTGDTVPTANILYENPIGQVTFFVDHLTVFAPGTSSSEASDTSSCFINTITTPSGMAAPLTAFIGMLLAGIAVRSVRRR